MYYEIFEELCKEKGVKPGTVSRATGVPTSTLTNWKQGNYTPKQVNLQKIADYFNVSIDYIMTGEEPQSAFTIEMAEIDLQLSNQNKRLKEYMLKLAELPKDKQENILNLIDMLREEK